MINFEKFNRGEAEKAMNEWLESYPNLPVVDGDCLVIRNDIAGLFEIVRGKVKSEDSYEIDSQFAILLYIYLKNQSWFSLRLAATDGFWRYMSLKVVPHLVAERWGKDNESHYWSLPRRIWLKQLWWYVHLAWRKDEHNTRKIIESPNCSTDTILNFVERSGKKGTCVDAYRWIIYFYSLIPSAVLSEYNKGRKTDDLFRVVMKLNTARMMVAEPGLCAGGYEGYARKLFSDAGIDINAISDDK